MNCCLFFGQWHFSMLQQGLERASHTLSTGLWTVAGDKTSAAAGGRHQRDCLLPGCAVCAVPGSCPTMRQFPVFPIRQRLAPAPHTLSTGVSTRSGDNRRRFARCQEALVEQCSQGTADFSTRHQISWEKSHCRSTPGPQGRRNTSAVTVLAPERRLDAAESYTTSNASALPSSSTNSVMPSAWSSR